ESWLDQVEAKADLWMSYSRRARLSEDVLARLSALPGARRALILVEDWCGDAIRSMPTLAAMADASEDLEVQVLDLAQRPEALEGRLTRGGRAVPIVVVLDGEGREIGSWGPRPAALQAILRAKIAREGAPDPDSKGEFYAPIMAWYAKDRGQAVAEEILMLLERD
ncbi:MAG: thioredoxin family protein, partial [Planctomycetota bacterium]